MIYKHFELIIDTVVKATNAPCPENMRLLIWGKYKDWDAVDFAEFILSDIENHKRKTRHTNS